jgi:hypothetical protein
MLSGSDPCALTGYGPVVIQDTEGQDAVYVYGSAVEATIQPWAGGQLLRVEEEASSYVNEMGVTIYESLFVDVMLSGPGGVLGAAAPVNLSGADRLEASLRGTVGALLLQDADGDLFGATGMPWVGGMIPGAFERYEATLEPTSWTLLGGSGDAALDLSAITGIGVRVTNETGPLIYGPSVDASIDSIGASSGVAPDPVIRAFHEDFKATGPDGYAPTGDGPVVIQDTEGEDAVHVYGSAVAATIQPWAGGQLLRVQEEASSYVNEMGITTYESLWVDVMLSAPGGVLGAAAPVDLSGAERLEASVRGNTGALLLQDADGDLFGATAMSMTPGMLPGAFERYEATLEPTMWTLLGGDGDEALDLSAITGMGVRVTNETMPAAVYDSTLDASIDSMGASSGGAPDPVVRTFLEDFGASGPNGYAPTGDGPVVIQDTEGQDAVYVYGSAVEAAIETWAGGQLLRVQKEASSYIGNMGYTTYESIVVDAMLSSPGGALGSAAPLNLSGADRVEASVRGTAGALLLRDADGDLFAATAMPMAPGMVSGAFERYEATLEPTSWTLLGGDGDEALDFSAVTGIGVRMTNETMSGSLTYGPTLDASIDSVGASSGVAPDPVIRAFQEDFEAPGPNGYAPTGDGPMVIQDTEGQDAVSIYGSAVEATIEPWAGGQLVHVQEEADSYTDYMGSTVYESLSVDVMLSGPGGALGSAAPLNLSGADRLEAYVRGTAEALLLRDADGDLFGATVMPIGLGMVPGALERYEATLDPMSWRLLNAGGNGTLDLWVITGIGVRVTNAAMSGAMSRGPTLDASIDSMGAWSGMAPDPVMRMFREDFRPTGPDGYAATGDGPMVIQDTEGQDAIDVYGSAGEVTIEPWAGGQLLHVQEEADSYTDGTGFTVYEALFVDVMLSGPGGALGAAAPLDLSGADRLEASVRGTTGTLLLRDADGDLFGATAMPMTPGMIPGAFERYEAVLDPMSWTLLGGAGDGALDLSAITGMGVRMTNQTMPGSVYDPTLDASIDSIGASSGMAPDPVVRVFHEDFEGMRTPSGLVPGDANGDGAVTDADYTIWADNYGTTGATSAQGDFNGDGTVTDADYTIWADNYGTGVTAAASATEASVGSAATDPDPVEPGLFAAGRRSDRMGPRRGFADTLARRARVRRARPAVVWALGAEAEDVDLLGLLSVPEPV